MKSKDRPLDSVLGRSFTALDVAANRLLGNYVGFRPRRPRELIVPRFFVLERRCSAYMPHLDAHLDTRALKHPAVISDATTWTIAGARLLGELKERGLQPIRLEAGRPSVSEVRRLVTALSRPPRTWLQGNGPLDRRLCALKNTSVVFAVGGGTVIDIGKLVARQLHVPCISVPTSLANDGIASPFAVIDPESAVPDLARVTVATNTPLGVIIDLANFRTEGGADFLRVMTQSGIGDIISNVTALLDWELAHRERNDAIDYSALMYSRIAAETILFREISAPSYEDDDFLLTLAAALVASGEAMARLGSSRPASGFEHKLYHAFHNLLRLPSAASHGVLVAVGTLISARAHGRYEPHIRSAFERAGLPTDAESLKRFEIDPEHVVRAIHAATRIKPERYTILEHLGPAKIEACFRETFGYA